MLNVHLVDGVVCSLSDSENGTIATAIFGDKEEFLVEDHEVVKMSREDFLSAQADELLQASEKYYPPKGAVAACKRILKLKEEKGDEVKGGTAVGWTRARQIASGSGLSAQIVLRMSSFFFRHKKNSKVDPKFGNEWWKDRGKVAWEIWGGDAAEGWSHRTAKKIREGRN